jgi:hypothetical protein
MRKDMKEKIQLPYHERSNNIVPKRERKRRHAINKQRTTLTHRRQAAERKAYAATLATFKPETWLIKKDD